MKELLEQLLEAYQMYPTAGLCYALGSSHTLIPHQDTIRKYMNNNIPVDMFYDCDGVMMEDSSQFWYPMGEKKPRIAWLHKHIKLNS